MRRSFVPPTLLSALLVMAFIAASAQRTAHAQAPGGCTDPKTGKSIECPEKKEKPTVTYPSFTPTSTLTPTPTATAAPGAGIPASAGSDTSAGLPDPSPAGQPFIRFGLYLGGAFLLGLLLWRAVRGINDNDNAPPAGGPPEGAGGMTMNNNETSMNNNETSMNSNETSMNDNDGGTSMNNNE